MTAKEKYDNIINFIEEEIDKGLNVKASNIIGEIKNKFYIEERSLGQIFLFLTNMPINSYIKQRQLMKAAEVILDGGSNQEAIQYTGFSDEPSFIKAFNKEFSLSPTSFARVKNSSIKAALSWDVITNNENEMISHKKSLEVTKFGVSIDIYKKVIEAENMQIIYGLNDNESEAAYKLSKAYGSELRDAFELIDELIIEFEDDKFYIENFDDLVKDYDDAIWMFFNFNLSFCESIQFVNELKRIGIKDFRQEDPHVIAYYYETGYDFDFVKECWEFYTTQNNCGVEFEMFMDFVYEYDSFETACEVLDCDISNMDFTIQDIELDEAELAMEKWASEETNYSNCDEIDDFYDPDNPEY